MASNKFTIDVELTSIHAELRKLVEEVHARTGVRLLTVDFGWTVKHVFLADPPSWTVESIDVHTTTTRATP